MKKIKYITLIIFTVLLIFNFKTYPIYAEDDGYYIKNMDVDVDVNDKREYKVVEKILVHFNEERHGIIRKIPTSSSLEDYKITNINVDGAPFTKSYDSDLELKIGDEDETIEGDKTYVISYTLKHYDDEQSDGDYIYLDVLGSEWDTYIENFTSTITYPQSSTLEKLIITDGQYGSTNNTLTNYHKNNNQIIISSKNTIDANTSITVNAKLNEGTFKNAPKKVYPYIIKEDTIKAEITKNKEYIIKRHFIIENNKNLTSSENYLNIWSNENNDYIKDVNISDNNISFSASDMSLTLPNEKGIYEFDVNYTIEPPLIEDVTFFITNNNLTKIEKLDACISSPYTINDYHINMNEFGVNIGSKRYEVSKDKNLIELRNLNNINSKENLNLTLNIDNALFTRPTLPTYYISLIISIAIIIINSFIYFKNKDSSPLISPVEFYPPNDLNPPELAFIYKEKITSRDIVSLIFYWASDNHLKIHMKENDDFTLTKLSNLDSKHKDYEKDIFNQLFSKGKDGKVTSYDLKDAYLDSIKDAICYISDFYKTKSPIMDKTTSNKSKLVVLLSFLPIIIAFIYNSIFTHTSLSANIISAIVLSSLFYLISMIYLSIVKKRHIHKGKLSTILYSILFSFFWIIIYIIFIAFTSLDEIIIFLVFLSSLISLILSGLLPHRSDYSKDLLGKIIGFRNFIEIAEKDRLEALLDNDADYFYKILPYAQVLGVTNKWIDKFKDISMENPSYIESDYPINALYMSSFIYSFDNINTTVASSSTAPSDLGGGFGGGGFSGGGSGGGGGSSW